ncbi:ABC-2 family transporter protein [Crateriforma conspicua]|uniref:ABC-2 family transporter protein n=2 Tax=Crateriforma conspicua TaxID=2527996 RepID=A0A5C5Y484_9PLAN|nr:ABC-2 family transporter protein [Crateriforma conspicua]
MSEGSTVPSDAADEDPAGGRVMDQELSPSTSIHPTTPQTQRATLGMIVDFVRFELSRSVTAGRLAVWFLLIAFPVVIVALLRVQRSVDAIDPWGNAVYFLIPEVTCLLGLLLWATPAVGTELEGQTWIYLATRTRGRMVVLAGKYVTAILWTFAAAAISLIGCTVLIGPDDPGRFCGILTLLAALSCLAHGAQYLLIGVFFFRRTMVAAVFYTLVAEYGLSFVPAIINQLTVNYQLRGLLTRWTSWRSVQVFDDTTFGNESIARHLLALLIVTAVCLTLAVYRVRTAQYPTQQDGGG